MSMTIFRTLSTFVTVLREQNSEWASEREFSVVEKFAIRRLFNRGLADASSILRLVFMVSFEGL